jgi:3-isopropylmalate dehydrogenase
MLLDHLGLDRAAARVESAVAADLAQRSGERSTREVGEALAAAVG